MLISKAYAQSVELSGDVPAALPDAPSAGEAFMWNMGMVVLLVFMFYILLIRPQQKRMKEHNAMLNALQKGDDVVTAGGLVGKITKIKDGENEVEVDLGNGTKVTALRSMLQGKAGSALPNAPAKDAKDTKAADKKPATKKAAKK